MNTKAELKSLQSESLYGKILLTEPRLREWVVYWGEDGVYISFSGGKDSTVLADIYARLCQRYGWQMYLVFVNTGLEYPEIQKFVKYYAEWLQKQYDIDVHLEILRPKMRFDEVIKKYGYPIIGKNQANAVDLARKNIEKGNYSYRLATLGITVSEAIQRGLKLPSEEMLARYEKSVLDSKFYKPKYKRLLNVDFRVSAYCCDVMKKNPAFEYQRKTGRKPILATMASESMIRENAWLKNGCNAFESKSPRSAPMSFWTEQDVLRYIQKYNIPIASVYGNVEYAEIPEQMRFEECGLNDFGTDKLTTTGCDRTGCIFCAFGCHREGEPSRFQRLKETHPRQYEYCIGGGEYNEKGIWQPSKEGLGMGHVFDELNKIYGEGFIKY
jgi:3'-phosphoadenosine 5'-phosphosulfate sulfotransferase (PAPS reductase)/FAD synthetase